MNQVLGRESIHKGTSTKRGSQIQQEASMRMPLLTPRQHTV